MIPRPEQLSTEDRQSGAESGLNELFWRLIENARAYVGAEIELIQTICLVKLKALQVAAVAAVIAILLCLAAFIALLVGLIIGLAHLIGPFFAAFGVSLIALVIAGVIGAVAIGNLRRHFAASFTGRELMEGDDDRPE